MKCKYCFNDKFIAYQIIYLKTDNSSESEQDTRRVIIDNNKDFFDDYDSEPENIIDCERYYTGPFLCTKCKKEYKGKYA